MKKKILTLLIFSLIPLLAFSQRRKDPSTQLDKAPDSRYILLSDSERNLDYAQLDTFSITAPITVGDTTFQPGASTLADVVRHIAAISEEDTNTNVGNSNINADSAYYFNTNEHGWIVKLRDTVDVLEIDGYNVRAHNDLNVDNDVHVGSEIFLGKETNQSGHSLYYDLDSDKFVAIGSPTELIETYGIQLPDSLPGTNGRYYLATEFYNSVSTLIKTKWDTIVNPISGTEVAQMIADSLVGVSGDNIANANLTSDGSYIWDLNDYRQTFVNSQDSLIINSDAFIRIQTENKAAIELSPKSKNIFKIDFNKVTGKNNQGTINSYINQNTILGDGVRDDIIWSRWVFNRDPTNGLKIDSTDVLYGYNFESNYMSNDGNPTLGKNTIEDYAYYVDSLGNGTRPRFWAATKDGSYSYHYFASSELQLRDHHRTKIAWKFDIDNRRLTYYDYNDMLFYENGYQGIKQKTTTGQIIGLLGLNGDNKVSIGGSAIGITLNDPVEISAGGYGLTINTPQIDLTASKIMALDQYNRAVYRDDIKSWIEGANDYNIFVNNVGGIRRLGINTNQTNQTLTVKDDTPSFGLYDNQTIWSTEQQSAFPSIIQGMIHKRTSFAGADGGILDYVYNKSSSSNARGYDYRAYLENNTLTNAVWIYRASKHDGAGGLTALSSNSNFVKWENHGTEIATLKSNGDFYVANTISSNQIEVNNNGNIRLKELSANGLSSTTLKAAEDVTASYTIETPSQAGGVDNIMSVEAFDGTTSSLKFIGKRHYQANATAAQVVINTGAAFNENKALWQLFINGIKYSHGLTGSEISTYDGNAGTITLSAGLSAGDRIEFYGQSQ